MADTYCIDTNIIIFMQQRIPRDVFPGPWDEFEALIAAGRSILPQEAHLELGKVDDGCFGWAKNLAGFVQATSAEELEIVTDISGKWPGWVTERKNGADPFLVAHAAIYRRVIVTDERRRGLGAQDHNLGVPNVADFYDVECLNYVGLARREGWRFDRP